MSEINYSFISLKALIFTNHQMPDSSLIKSPTNSSNYTDKVSYKYLTIF